MSRLWDAEDLAQVRAEGWLTETQVAARLAGDPARLPALMVELLTVAAEAAQAEVSQFAVGAVAAGLPDALHGAPALYLGANLEFAGAALACTAHAEQTAAHHAWARGATGLSALATSAPPCGHCRQFLAELGAPETLRLITADARGAWDEATLAELLPASFSPEQLGVEQAWMAAGPAAADEPGTDALLTATCAAARSSHAPYTGARSAVGLGFADADPVIGRLVESVAFNPSLPPLTAALSLAWASRPESERATPTRVLLVEAPARCSLRASTEALLAAVLPQLQLEFHRLPGVS